MTRPLELPARVFVYGTLKPGMGNAHVATGTAAPRLVVPARLEGHRLYDLGPFPAIEAAAAEAPVRGFLYDYDPHDWPAVLARLDALEGYAPGRDGNLYNRVQVEVRTEDGRAVTAWTYVFARPLDGYALVASGDWHPRRTRR